MKKIVIDTDAGTDCDDLFALVYALRNPNCSIEAISTVIGDTRIRAKIVRKLERILGVNVPIIPGKPGPEESVKKYWTGIEQLALTPEELTESIEESSFPKYGSETVLACIGPLTNIAYQIQTNPSIRQVRQVYVMGSTDSSHNFKADLEAWKEVEKQPWAIYQITKPVSEKVSFTKEELEALRGNPLGYFLCDSAIQWLDYTKRERACMYDVLAVSAAIGESYVKFQQLSDNRFISTDINAELKNRLLEAIKLNK
jgi:purine nucleosidase